MPVGAERDLLQFIRGAGDGQVPTEPLNWVVSNPAVLTVDSRTGRATSLSTGIAVVTARLPGQETGGAQVIVTVAGAEKARFGVKVLPALAHLAVGETVSLQAQVRMPDGQINANVVWSSSDDAIAKVNQTTGVVSVLKPGRVTIVAAYLVDPQFKGLADLVVYATRAEIPASPSPTPLVVPAGPTSMPPAPVTWTSQPPYVNPAPSPTSPSASVTPSPATATVSTLGGRGAAGFADGPGAVAKFNYPFGMATDGSGNLYVADSENNRIRKITPSGDVTTVAGNGEKGFAEGLGTAAQFAIPSGVAVDGSGTIFVADTYNLRIRMVTQSGDVTTLAGSGAAGRADGPGAEAQFLEPFAIAVDRSGTLYVADQNRIRKVTPSGEVTTLAGSGEKGFADGAGAAAQFNYPSGLAVDESGTVYVADSDNNRIRKVTPGGVVSTLAGSTPGFADGTGAEALFEYPSGLAVDRSGSLYVADSENHRIRKITRSGEVTTLAGRSAHGFVDGSGAAAQFNYPIGLCLGTGGSLYVADTENHRIRKVVRPR
jgi:sugar lactone lactonase YvrE